MKKRVDIILILIMMLLPAACGKQELAEMITDVNKDYAAIIWEDRAYVPYCAIAKTDCGKQIGIVDGDKDDRVYEYKGYSTAEWIINSYGRNHDSVMLYREMEVSDIPEGLRSEYEWN